MIFPIKTTLLIYMMLSPTHHWEFLMVDHVSADVCQAIKTDTKTAFTNTPGNFKIICTDDIGADI